MWSSFGILLILNLLCCKFYGKILYMILRIQVNSVWFRHFGYSEIKNRNSFINYNTPLIVWSSFFFHFFEKWRKYTRFNFWQYKCCCITETKNVINKIVGQTKTTISCIYRIFQIASQSVNCSLRNHVHLQNMVSRKCV